MATDMRQRRHVTDDVEQPSQEPEELPVADEEDEETPEAKRKRQHDVLRKRFAEPDNDIDIRLLLLAIVALLSFGVAYIWFYMDLPMRGPFSKWVVETLIKRNPTLMRIMGVEDTVTWPEHPTYARREH